MLKEILIKDIIQKFELISKSSNPKQIQLLANEILELIVKIDEDYSESLSSEILSLQHTISKEVMFAINAEIDWLNDSSSLNKKKDLEKYIQQSILHIKTNISSLLEIV
jgi:hypothetical protein